MMAPHLVDLKAVQMDEMWVVELEFQMAETWDDEWVVWMVAMWAVCWVEKMDCLEVA